MTGQENQDNNPEATELRAEKFGRLIHERDSAAIHSPRWSRFVRRARLVLPLVALTIFAVVFVWSDVQRNNIIPAKDLSKTPAIGKNELVNPRFESTDSDNQPFTLTAARAIQGKEDENLVMLEEPLGDLLLKSGERVAAKADRGSFRQDNRMLLLRGKVRLYHDKGYQLEMEELDVDLRQNTAFSKVDVAGHGPAGTLAAKGLTGEGEKGLLVFNGPARLVLTNVSGGPKEMMP